MRNFGPLKESEDYFVDSVLPSWEARLTMGLHFIFRVSFQQEALCSCMHERRGMCPEIMIFLPKSEVWLRDVFGKFLYGVFFFSLDIGDFVGTFLHKHIQFNPSHSLNCSLLFCCFCSLSVRGNVTLGLGPERLLMCFEYSEISNLSIWACEDL